jgi:hypothetical protein
METVYQGVLIGVIATIGQDIWEAIVKHIFRFPTAGLALIGRWLGHMPRGVFVRYSIRESAVVPHELLIGWVAHYVTGILYGVTYLSFVQILLKSDPTILSAVIFGWVSLMAPWFIVQPGMGLGVFASKAPRPGMVRLVSLSLHMVFGLSLYAAWLLI